jgi:hypothetical protein
MEDEMAQKLYDFEFSPWAVSILRKRTILTKANFVHAVPLDYGIEEYGVRFEKRFQKERRENPLLEQTAPEAWISAVLSEEVRAIRCNVEISDSILDRAIQKYLRHRCPPVEDEQPEGERLITTIEPFQSAIESLLRDLFNRQKSLFGILGLRQSEGSIRRIITAAPKSKRDKIFSQGINEKWPNRRLAQALDDAGIKPASDRWNSYQEMYHQNPEQFRVLKSQTKRKYLVPPLDTLRPNR